MKNKIFSIFLIFISIILLASVASAAQMIKIGTGHDPAIYGNMVTWSEDTGSIHLYDLTAQKGTTISSSNSSHPAIYGNKIVWHDESSGISRLTVYDIPSGARSYITQNVDSTSIPKIYGNRIVWSSNGNVYLRDISTSIQTQIAVGRNPDIYDTKVVYSADSRENKDIFMYDITTRKIELISSESSDLDRPHMYGNKVTWTNSHTRMGFIQMYDLITKNATDVTSDNVYSGDPNNPDAGDDTGTHTGINGDKVIYAKISDDIFGNAGVYVYDISTKQSTPVINYPAGVYMAPDIYDNTIVWGFADPSMTGTASDDIYMCNLTATADTVTQPPVAGFISNVISGSAPLSVAFTDASTGAPNAWSWIFGDGANSTEQNPIHTYSRAGNYTVRLTVSNANGTDSKLAAITVSEKPLPVILVANFTSNTTEGYAPLAVQFTDLSTKVTGWNWNFGDGTNSTEQNPIHIYTAAGIYYVNLTIGNEYGSSSKIATIIVLQHPVYAYIANFGSNTTSVIDTITNNVIATVNVGSNPYGVGISSDGSKVYVTNNESNTVSIIDAATKEVTATINVGNKPKGVAVAPDGTKVYVANCLDNTTSVIDTTTNTVIATVPVGSFPTGVAVTPDGTKAYVTSATYIENSTYSSIVSVIDTTTNTVTASVPVGTASTGIAITPNGKKVYVANCLDNTTSVIDTATNTVIATVSVGTEPWGVTVSPDGTKIYVVNSLDNTVSVIDTATNTVTATVPVGLYPVGVSITPDGKEIYVTNGLNGTVSVIDTTTNNVKATVNVGELPYSLGQFIEQPVFPFANFNSNVIEGYAPLTVKFTDLSKNAFGWNWSFGDGGISTDQNPIHTYSAPGTYNVNLTVINAKGIASKTGIVTVLEGSSSNGGSSSGSGSSNGDSSGGSSHSGGGGGSGGAGGSPEPQNNVEIKELSQIFIASGSSVRFDFPQKTTPVVYISFDSKKTAGKTTTIAEMLKNKSTLSSDAPTGEVYKYLNIWVGNSGYATEKNIENAVICFKVEKSWIQNKKIDKSSITLNRYSDKIWNQLPTSLSSEDDNYLYLTAQTPGFSPFAITGKTTAKEAVNDTQTKPNTENTTANIEQTPEQKQSSNISGKESTKTPAFEIVSGIISLLCVFLYKKSKKE